MQQTSTSLANFLDGLATTLKEAAHAARSIHDREASLPSVLHTRHISELEGWSDTTTWRKAKLGEYGSAVLSAPGEPLRVDRDTYLANRHERRVRLLAQHMDKSPTEPTAA